MGKQDVWASKVWDWVKKLVLPFLVIYLAATLIYQARGVVREAKWGTQVVRYEARVYGGTCKLAVRYPEKIPLEPEGRRGRPLTVWAWREDAGCPAKVKSFHVLFSSPDDRIVFTDEDGKPSVGCLDVEVAEREAEAEPQQLYVSRRPGVLNDGEAQLRVRAEVMTTSKVTSTAGVPRATTVTSTTAVELSSQLEVPLRVRLETAWEAALRQGCDLLLGTKALSLTSLVATAWGIWESEQRRRKKAEAEREKQRRDAVAMRLQQWVKDEHISWVETWELLRKAEEFSEEFYPQIRGHLRMLRERGRVAWLYEMRQWLAGELRKDAAELWRITEELGLIGVLDEEERQVLLQFARMIAGGGPGAAEDALAVGLRVLDIVGLSGAGVIVETVQKLGGLEKEQLREQWYKGGGAAGRYLVRELAGRDGSVKRWLEKWKEAGINPGLRPLAGLCRLWQREPDDLEDKLTPFGPVKAECDPRLPKGWFYDEHPAWERVKARSDGLFFFPPGGGRSAFLLMGRRYYSMLGAGGPALSLYVELCRLPKDERNWTCLWRDALAESLACALSVDPFWLLAAEEEGQREIGALLLGWAGGWHRLRERLGRRGVRTEKGDGRLLMELLARFEPYTTCAWEETEAAASFARGALKRVYGVEGVPLFIWVDVRCEEEKAREIIGRLWRDTSVRALGYLKVFAGMRIATGGWMEAEGIEGVKVEWSEEQLKKMLEHRLSIARASDLIGDAKREELVRKAEGSPTRLIQVGNVLWQEMP